jgi:hypothetical protein
MVPSSAHRLWRIQHAKAPSDAGIQAFTAIICLDTSRFRYRVIPLSRTLPPVSSQWFD